MMSMLETARIDLQHFRRSAFVPAAKFRGGAGCGKALKFLRLRQNLIRLEVAHNRDGALLGA
jgi:hypothetical protein